MASYSDSFMGPRAAAATEDARGGRTASGVWGVWVARTPVSRRLATATHPKVGWAPLSLTRKAFPANCDKRWPIALFDHFSEFPRLSLDESKQVCQFPSVRARHLPPHTHNVHNHHSQGVRLVRPGGGSRLLHAPLRQLQGEAL